ncbi:MAG: aldo/keto reductase [Treponema sp.]|nr:aldo/keto reductase [Treponema sp.]
MEVNFTNVQDSFILNNGVKIPCVGFGTWRVKDGEEAYNSVRWALDAGYRHIDTATAYENESSIGKALKDSGIERKEIFITTKLGNSDHGYKKTVAAFNKSLELLQTDYLDLYLIHWPNPIMFRDNWKNANAESWKAFEEFYEQGKIKAIGVSNFWEHHLDALKENAKILPQVNQIRLCPGETQDNVVKYCKEKNILLEAYSPFGAGKVFDVPELQNLAKKYEKNIAQICLMWCLQNGFLPLPKSVTKERIISNMDCFGFTLSEEDMNIISGLTGVCGMTRNPDLTEF